MPPEHEEKFPDYRFTLANERTFLAWIRTALAFMAAAIAVDQLAIDLAPAMLRGILVVVLGLTAAGLSFYGYHRWHHNEQAIRKDRALPFPRLLLWLSGGLSAGIICVLTFMVTA
ncbi:YidH family protein [Klebsiella aerogenes]